MSEDNLRIGGTTRKVELGVVKSIELYCRECREYTVVDTIHQEPKTIPYACRICYNHLGQVEVEIETIVKEQEQGTTTRKSSTREVFGYKPDWCVKDKCSMGNHSIPDTCTHQYIDGICHWCHTEEQDSQPSQDKFKLDDFVLMKFDIIRLVEEHFVRNQGNKEHQEINCMYCQMAQTNLGGRD